MEKKIKSLISLFICLIFILSCKKENIHRSLESQFCESISGIDFDDLVQTINKYLKNQNEKFTDEEKINDLKNWLIKTECLTKAQVLCISCIKTNPPMSEIRIGFTVKGKTIEKTFDIKMENPLFVSGYHD
jgi:hypothetical protein